jgi:hypothetical protein
MNMAQLLLEYLKVLITWPFAILIVAIFFMISQRKAIARLIDRIRHVNFPGGKIDTEYNSELLKERSNPEISTPSVDPSKRIEVLEKDFNNFILAAVESNNTILDNLIKVLMDKYGVNLFDENKDHSVKMQLLFDRIDKNAVKDYQAIQTILNKQTSSREELMQTYVKTKLLGDYFRGLATRR